VSQTNFEFIGKMFWPTSGFYIFLHSDFWPEEQCGTLFLLLGPLWLFMSWN